MTYERAASTVNQFQNKHNIASAIIGGQKTWERKAADFYPTPPDATFALLKHLELVAGTKIKEPACGDGAMARVMEACGYEVDASDLRTDSGFGRGGVDFIEENSNIKPEWIITNPPFNLAVSFIEKALTITSNVAMLLKSQFWHARRRTELFEQSVPNEILPLTWRPSFLEAERSNSPLMDVIWVVWKKEYNTVCHYKPLKRPLKSEIPTAKVKAVLGDLFAD